MESKTQKGVKRSKIFLRAKIVWRKSRKDFEGKVIVREKVQKKDVNEKVCIDGWVEKMGIFQHERAIKRREKQKEIDG